MMAEVPIVCLISITGGFLVYWSILVFYFSKKQEDS